jgi:hypothetical protein
VDDQAADRRSKQRPDQRGDDDEIHRLQQFRLGKGAYHGEPPDRHHHSRAHSLQNTRRHHLRQIHGEPAKHRGNRENRNGDGKHAPRAVSIGDPTTHRNADSETENIAGYHGL